jgi:hypothetical protein
VKVGEFGASGAWSGLSFWHENVVFLKESLGFRFYLEIRTSGGESPPNLRKTTERCQKGRIKAPTIAKRRGFGFRVSGFGFRVWV